MSLSNTSIAALRQQMDDSNHELESAETNRQVANQLTRLCNFLGASTRQMAQVVRQTIPVQVEIGAAEDETVHEGQILKPQQNQGVESGVAGRNQMVLVNRHQDADQIVDQDRQEDLAVENNLTTIVEKIMARNGMSATLQRPLYASPLAEFILQTEAPRGTKAAFTWFTSLALNSIGSWAKLEKKFHEQFYEGHSKINLAELSSIKKRFAESIDDYLNRFRSLKARCFTQVPEHELVQMAGGGLDYSIRKKVDPNFVKSMSQLADRVRHLERLRDLVQKAIQERRLKFAGHKMKIDADPLHQEDALFV
ncbi:uncharacterized protein LOC127101789 [Lathyrus oleraceus]|uniref:uncharacterized protein LOC127101789 n=1 Tax=Pisum sativum TaxID=3888 RepID=UPI0021D2D574|nr:uncharacterized protein LOC127101789 [Pisum sativum]